MNYKYLALIFGIFIIGSFVCCACNAVKETKIVIKHESRYSKLMKKKLPSHVIDLSDGNDVNFDYNVGPGEISSPSFKIITVDTP